MKSDLAKSNFVCNVKKFYPQLFTGGAVFLIMFEVGLMSGWSSPYLQRLKAPDSPIPLQEHEAPWIAALLNAGRFFGAFAGAILLNFVGSKHCLTLAVIPIVLCWLCTAVAKSVLWLYVARIAGGFGLGFTYSCMAMYVGEVALPEIRGAIIVFSMAAGGSLGTLLVSISGRYLSMNHSALLFTLPCLVALFVLVWLPNAPHWLVRQERYKKAEESIAWYHRGKDHSKELDCVKSLVSDTQSQTFSDKLKKLNSPPLRRAAMQIFLLFTFMQLTGLNSIVFYMEEIVARSQGDEFTVDPSMVVIYVHCTSIVSSVAASSVIDKFGRKCLLIVSSTGVAMAMAGLASNAYVVNSGMDVSNLQWLPIASIFLFMNSYFVGLMSVPSTVLSEIFPSDVKNVAGCFASLVGAFWSFASTYSFKPLVDSVGEIFVFAIHGTFALMVIPYVCIFLPETKGKSLKEIQDLLTGVRYK